MKELYDFYLRDDKYGSKLMEYFTTNKGHFFHKTSGVPMASKSGFALGCAHDMTIVFEDNPYIMVGLSRLMYGNYDEYFTTVGNLTSRLHSAYWNYKMQECKNIN